MTNTLPTGQVSENHKARTVLVCAPSALSKMMGSLHPAGALYEKPVNTKQARAAHDKLISILKRRGINVMEVRNILVSRVGWSIGDRLALENLASKCLQYKLINNNTFTTTATDTTTTTAHGNNNNAEDHHYYVSDKYKQSVIEEMDEQQLVDIIFTNPTVSVSPSDRDTGFTARYTFEPLSNIVFVRDQQITTRRGIVMANLTSAQRQREVDIMEFVLRKQGLNVIGRVPAPGHLEGGDFFPVNADLCLLGIGPRSNMRAVEYLLENEFFETRRVGVVKDELEQCQDRMHLDTVFNIIGEHACLMLDEMMGDNSPTKRMVDEYQLFDDGSHKMQNGDNNKQVVIGKYHLVKKNVEFAKYITENGFHIIKVSGQEQLKYGCNALNLGNGDIISIEKNVARRIAQSPHFNGTVEWLNFDDITCMYGGVHCASQVVYRDAGSTGTSPERPSGASNKRPGQ